MKTTWASLLKRIKTHQLVCQYLYWYCFIKKATPAFDVIDYGQEDYVFGSSAREGLKQSFLLAISSKTVYT